MDYKKIRITIVVIVIFVVLALLLGGQMIYKRYNIEQPLFKVYSKTKAVQDTDIINRKGKVKVELVLGSTVNFQKTYRELMEETAAVLGERPFELKIKDNRDQALERLLIDVEPVIYEAVSKGSFTWMKQEIIRAARAAGAETQVFIDGERIYVSFLKGRHVLYEVIQRSQPIEPDSGKGSDISG
ncbi:MAG: hypothetical protein M0Z31_00280 [Clostridia bacterium]|nr:hypothetical protein [Clostridia bacterium]